MLIPAGSCTTQRQFLDGFVQMCKQQVRLLMPASSKAGRRNHVGGWSCVLPEGGSVRVGSLRSRELFKSEGETFLTVPVTALGWTSWNASAKDLFFLRHLSRG